VYYYWQLTHGFKVCIQFVFIFEFSGDNLCSCGSVTIPVISSVAKFCYHLGNKLSIRKAGVLVFANYYVRMKL
jgi:hypothetical protein